MTPTDIALASFLLFVASVFFVWVGAIAVYRIWHETDQVSYHRRYPTHSSDIGVFGGRPPYGFCMWCK